MLTPIVARPGRFNNGGRLVTSDQAPSYRDLGEAVQEIFLALCNLLNEEHDSAQARLERAATVLQLAPRSTALPDPRSKITPQLVRGGLAPWQARLVKTHIETHIDAAIRTKELAQLAQLSAFHFCRVFRTSFGHSPHSYVTRRRLERAQGLMLATKLPLRQIALDCGFADQAHFTKQFRRFAGESPAQWRRMRAGGSSNIDLDPVPSSGS